jgi:hypothetical protein
MKTTNKATGSPLPPRRFRGWACAAGTFLRRSAVGGLSGVAAVPHPSAPAVLILAAAGLAAIGPALGLRAQGSIELDNSQSTGRVAIDQPGNYYGGVYGVEVWELNANALPPGLNGTPGLSGYLNMLTNGFVHVATFADQNNSSTPGIIRLGEVDMPNAVPAGANVVIALAIWDNAATSYLVWAGKAGPLDRFGFLAFMNPTADYTAFPTPAPPALSGWTSDLLLVELIPEPSPFALAGVGVAAWLLVRRRRNRG